jgi:uncharacterized protein (TIGR02679 family)
VTAVDTEVLAYLQQPGLCRPLAHARERFERLGRVGGIVVVDDLSGEEANALAGLLPLRRRDRPRAGRPFRLRLGDVDEALLATRFGISLRDALELVGPPLDLRPQRMERERAATIAAWEEAWRHPLCRRDPRVRAWVESIRESGLVMRLAGAEATAVLGRSLDLGSRLPAALPVERTRLATEFTGDPHALDENRALTRLTLSQLAYRAGVARPEVAVARRALWQQFGVTSDPASADVLTLNLRPLPSGPLAQALRLMEGRHFRLTVGQLTQEPLGFQPGVGVFVCENTTVLTAAETRLGAACPPILCTGGWPTSAAWSLLEVLRAAGATLVHHGDFDWDGVRIATLLRERFGVRPWRFDAESYRAGVECHPERTRALDGRPAREEADAALVVAMRETGLELHEEAVLEDLLDDLAQAASTRVTTGGRLARSPLRSA